MVRYGGIRAPEMETHHLKDSGTPSCLSGQGLTQGDFPTPEICCSQLPKLSERAPWSRGSDGSGRHCSLAAAWPRRRSRARRGDHGAGCSWVAQSVSSPAPGAESVGQSVRALRLLAPPAPAPRWAVGSRPGRPADGMAPFCLNCSIFLEDLSPEDTRSPVPCNGTRAWGLFDPEDLNLTDKMLRLKYLGPQQTDLLVPICATYLLIFMVGTVGNGLTCVVILCHKTMRTPTNCYLLSLAVSDLLVLLVGLPLELYEMWHNYPFLLGAGGCYFRTLLFETVCLASVLNVTALSVERYVAVVHPLQARSVVTQTHVRRVLGAVWGLAVLCSLPNTSLHGIQRLHVPCRGLVPDSAICTLVRPRALYNLVVQTTTVLFFCLPMATISVLYLLIGLRLRRERLLLRQEAKGRGAAMARSSDSCRLRRRLQDRGRRQVTKMLFVLVVVFGICWAPFHADRLMWSFVAQWTDGLHLAYQYLHVISGVFFYLSLAANPVLYSLMSSRFRETFQEALCFAAQCRHHRPRHSSYSLNRVTTGSMLCDLGPSSGRALPLVDSGPEGLQETDSPGGSLETALPGGQGPTCSVRASTCLLVQGQLHGFPPGN
ncbi:neuromedin-U receptor 1 [Orycteropus afer afer]|uniref:Neuromedin-U receptor 1 n=1 Tax=Orycteropus afer afer TaxID=1230840 RepID=A0A8B7A244_ORYAF|nr:neuromedin-U receptor 1 [Orycteropus afer afer]